MKSNISKSLGAMVARATFSTMRDGVKRNLLDHLFLEMITFEDSLAFESLATHLESWQLYQLRQSVERSHTERAEVEHSMRPEFYYVSFLRDLAERHPHGEKMTSLHALHYIALDATSATSQGLSSLGLTPQLIELQLLKHVVSSDITKNSTVKVHTSPSLKSQDSKTPHPLSRFGVELTQLAREGRIDPVVGREAEIERVVQVLSRRKKNNPILIGEAGVGKSAVVEGLALRIVSGDVPHTIADRRLFSLDLSSLVAGTKFRGEFEERMKQLLEALRKSNDSIIFIDEIHTIVGAGSSQGSLDVANILKPALSRGELQTIGATTLDEYRRDIESDAALVRRFQRVLVEPTTEAQTLQILKNIAPHYEAHHHVKYSSEALTACVKLSMRYLTDSHLPDKAIDLLDEAGSLSRPPHTTPHEINTHDIERVVTMITGIPIEQLSVNETARLKGLAPHLHSQVIGQREAVDTISRTILRSRAGLRDAGRPIGTFLFVGSTGVGKTLLAKELSRWMFDTKNSLLRIDMSEYNLSHSLSRLIGSPPGYVGYGQGGELTEPIRRNPYSVVLLDEIEKAHGDIFNLLLQLLDEGHLTDGAGRRVDFCNTIIIMTSNVGSHIVAKAPPRIGYGAKKSESHETKRGYNRALMDRFPPEFLNRIDATIIFNELERKDFERIVELELSHTFRRIKNLGYNIRITSTARREIAQIGYDRVYGARSLRRKLVDILEEPISNMIISGEIEAGQTIVIEKMRQKSGIKLKVA